MASATINVFVKLPTGKAIELHHLPGESVRDIAKKVADSEKVPENRVRIKYQGKQLDKKKTISYLGICEETILKAEILTPRDTNLTIQLPDGENVHILLQSTDTVSYLKQRIEDKSGITKATQLLKVNGSTNALSVSQDTTLLIDAGLSDGCEVTVEKRPKQDTPTDCKENEEVNEAIKQELLDTFNTDGKNVEVVFCFDTTGSMYSCLREVRTQLRETCSRLLRDIPNIRIGIMANGDYCDQYVVRYQDLTTNVDAIVEFAENVPSTGGGGNGGEAYEWAFRRAQELDWSEESAKAFVLIADEPPHISGFTDQNVFWKDEVDILGGMGVKVYGVQALQGLSQKAFYQEIADRTGGFYLQLRDFRLITDMFLAVCYREADDGQLDNFVEEVEKDGRLTEDTKLFLDKLDEKDKPTPQVIRESDDDRYPNLDWWRRTPQKQCHPSFLYNQLEDTWTNVQTQRLQATSSGLRPRILTNPPKKKSKLKRFLSIFSRKG